MTKHLTHLIARRFIQCCNDYNNHFEAERYFDDSNELKPQIIEMLKKIHNSAVEDMRKLQPLFDGTLKIGDSKISKLVV